MEVFDVSAIRKRFRTLDSRANVAEAPVQILYLSPSADGVERTRERPPNPA